MVKRNTVSMTVPVTLTNGSRSIRLPEIDDPLALHRFHFGKDPALSVENFTDLDLLVSCLSRINAVHARNHLGQRYIAIFVKNGVVWGAATHHIPDKSAQPAARVKTLESAIRGIARAVQGSSVLTNFPLGDEEAQVLRYGAPSTAAVQERAYSLVVAPEVDSAAYALLKPGRRSPCLVLQNPNLVHATERERKKKPTIQTVRGGFLMRPHLEYVLNLKDRSRRIWGPPGRVATQQRDLALAWAVGSCSRDIAITVVKNGAVIANATDAIDHRAAESHISSILSFNTHHESVAYCGTPFPSEADLFKLDHAGVRTLLTAYGREKHESVAAYCQKMGITLVWFPIEHLRH